MLAYKFYIRNNQDTLPAYVEVDEPIGWDGVEFTLQRSDQYEGLENLYSDDLTFYGNAGEILLSAFNVFGFDALLDFKIEFYCDGVLNTTIETVINMLTYRRVGNETTVKLESSSFERKFKNRLENKVNFQINKSVEGVDLTPLEPFDLRLHSKEIFLESTRVLTNNYDIDTFEFVQHLNEYVPPAGEDDFIVPPFNAYEKIEDTIPSGGSGWKFVSRKLYFQYDFSKIVTNDEDIGEFYGLLFDVTNQSNPYLKVKYSGTLNINLNFNISAFIDVRSSGGTFPKIKDCPDPAEGYNVMIDFAFHLYIKIGDTEYIYPISSGVRDNCDEEYYGDLIGKHSHESTALAVYEYYNIIDYPDVFRFTTVSLNQNFPCEKGDNIYVLIRATHSGEYEKRGFTTHIETRGYSWIDKEGSFLNFSNVSRENPSTAEAYHIYEAYNRVLESITDTPNAFRSNFFGRLNSQPQQYDLIGCGAWTALTNGLNIRKMLDKDSELFPFVTSFSELFKSCNAIWNLGCRVEQDELGNYYLRVEPKEYFYDNQNQVITFEEVANIETIFAVDKLFNYIEVGYDKWEIENINGIDEFNTKHFYEIPLVNVKQRLNLNSSYIASGYVIEMTRRIQYSINPTTDWAFDNDNFFIALNRGDVTSDKYSNPPVSQSYPAGEVAERNENYITVTNLISPQTSYNLRLSPANMMLNWFKSLAPIILLKPEKIIKFVHGYANITLYTERVDECSVASGGFKESQHLQLSSTIYSTLEIAALFKPNYINFEYPIDFSNFMAIKEGSNKLIRVNCGNFSYFGFVKEIKFQPNNGTANFKLLITGCIAGGFDSGFDIGFEIGTC